MADPDVEMVVATRVRSVSARTFQQDPGFYRSAEEDEGRVDARVERQLNTFLGEWMQNCIEQGHYLVARDDGDGDREPNQR